MNDLGASKPGLRKSLWDFFCSPGLWAFCGFHRILTRISHAPGEMRTACRHLSGLAAKAFGFQVEGVMGGGQNGR